MITQCPRCGLQWWMNPPAKVAGMPDHGRCIECKRVYRFACEEISEAAAAARPVPQAGEVADIRRTPGGSMEIIDGGVWTPIPAAAADLIAAQAAEISALRAERDAERKRARAAPPAERRSLQMAKGVIARFQIQSKWNSMLEGPIGEIHAQSLIETLTEAGFAIVATAPQAREMAEVTDEQRLAELSDFTEKIEPYKSMSFGQILDLLAAQAAEIAEQRQVFHAHQWRQLQEARTRIAELEAALRPFAERAEKLTPLPSIDDYRRARDVLAPAGKDEVRA